MIRHGVTLRQAFRVWLRIAALSFGGPADQIAVMHRILVEEKRWIGEKQFLCALYGSGGFVSARSFGLKAAVLTIVLQALLRIVARALRNRSTLAASGADSAAPGAARPGDAVLASLAPWTLLIAAAAVLAVFGVKRGMAATPAVSAAAGLALHFAGVV